MIENFTPRASSNLTVDFICDEPGLEALGREWDALLEQSAQRTFFLRWDWNRLWWRTYAPAGARLRIITCRDATGTLVGLAPLYLKRHRAFGLAHAREILFLGSGIHTRTSEDLDICARRGWEREVGDAIARSLRRDLSWDRLSLTQVPAASNVMPHFLEGLGQGARTRPGAASFYVDTRGEWDKFRSSLGRSMRSNLAYYTRRLFSTHACSFQRVDDAKDLDPAMDAFIALHQAWWRSRGEAGSFALPRFEAFLKDAMRSSLASGRLRLWTLTIDGAVSAALVGFCEGGVVHYFQSGFDPFYAKDSLGTVMIGLCLQDCFADPDISEFDLMAGGASHKRSWTRLERATIDLGCERPGPRLRVLQSLEVSHQWVRSALRAVVPESLWATLHRRAARRRV